MSAPDLVRCVDCRHCAPNVFRCSLLKRGELIELERRCPFFVPLPSVADQRTGAQRWPNYDADLAKTRAEDAAQREAHG